MKKVILASLMMPVFILMTGCTKSEFLTTTTEDMRETQDVSLSFFETSIGSLDDRVSRATTGAAVSDIYKRLDVAFISKDNGKDSIFHRCIDNDEDVNSLHVTLPIGNYKLVAIASKASEEMIINSETDIRFPDGVIYDMASCYQELEVRKDAPVVACSMHRAIASFILYCTDGCDMKKYPKIVFELSGNCGTTYDATEEKSDDSNGYTRTFEPSNKGIVKTMRINTLLCSNKEDVTITVKIYDTKGNISKKYKFVDVTLEKGKITKYTGTMFSEGSDLNFTVSDPIDMPDSDYGKEFSDEDLVTNDTQK